MCGIVGFFGSNLPGFEDALSILAHRGPDGTSSICQENYALGHNRLAIIDVEGGQQPLYDPQSKLYAIANGEIYNHQQWRDRLQGNYNFSTNSDTEILLPLYQKFGTQMPQKIRGMFSFILASDQEFFVARDRLGIKPLYYAQSEEGLFFASEIKALIEHGEQIKEFPPGHYYHSNEGLQPYYDFPEVDVFLEDVEVILEKIRQGLSQSVRRRLMSDVPVGVFLSGGLDSSIIAALMKRELSELHSFSTGFANSPDLKAARLVAEYLGTIHHEYIYSEAEMLSVLPEVIYHFESYDPAWLRSCVPTYLLSHLASQYVKVVLGGDASDELFAGYSYLADYNDGKTLNQELVYRIKGLHNLNLQKLDRLTMAHGLEARVPFLDIDFVEMALTIDPTLKLYQRFGIEKWLLRKAFEDYLPPEIVWRDKMEFAHGSASSKVLAAHAEATISDQDFDRARFRGDPIKSKEELLYYRIFEQYFPQPFAVNLVGKWDRTFH
ncbi:asparagine synthase B [Moorena sp. SIO4G3]|uniref:asparagine synthase B n=1 Tax=Moorena sp. SIO4G3 TaxID=2607821 RepID=UPI0013CAF00A|nr:asparagine synthase B [Moorena sp. SIO4G3]NEO79728.1 asparagine synthase B [Moorena sp. SIO4G3]NEO90266.1 asparagine synthase B [Moorena sp. SIO3G5]